MADIRQSVTIKDDFNRANADPVGAPWATANSGGWAQMAISSNQLIGTQTPPTSSGSYWTTRSWDYDQAEVWATAVGTVGNNEDWRLGLMRDDGVGVRDGYTLHYGLSAGNDFWQFRRYDDGSFTGIALDDNPSVTLGSGSLALVRRNGANVEGWVSTDGGANWTNVLTATNDTTYTTGLYAMLGAGGNVMGWDDFGGGPLITPQQHYRWLPVPTPTP